jgi:HPt (histidine-containing phosphotransfer) domain-containing protein
MGAVDFGYLEGFLSGDRAIVLEVLALFEKQAQAWFEALDDGRENWRETAHTIKGAARGVGARALGDACERAEFGKPEDLAEVRTALAAALVEIAAYREEHRGPA